MTTLTLIRLSFPITVAFNELTIGIANGWVAPTLNTLQTGRGEFLITMEESSWMASLDSFGKILGALFTALILDSVGRKVLLASSAFVFFSMWLVPSLTNSVSLLCLMRLVFGIFNGINDGVNSIYLAENSSPIIRGVFGTVCITLYYVGLLGEYVVATYLPYTRTILVNCVVTFIAFLSVFWIKEPVQFLLLKGKRNKAEKNFLWLRGLRADTIDPAQRFDYDKIEQNVQLEKLKKTSFKELFGSPANCKSLFVMITIYCLVGCTGYYPVMSFASLAFSATDILSPNEFTILFGVAQLIVVVSTSLFIGRFNRRAIILISFSIIAFSHAATASLYYIHESIVPIPCFPWLVFASITIFASVYAFVYPAIFLIRGELFPLSIKATGGCLSVIGFSIMSFVMTKIFLALRQHCGIGANFLVFSFVSLLIVTFVYFLLPETKNKSLLEIQEMLEKAI